MNSVNEMILGFDLRQPIARQQSYWSTQRRSTHLYRHDCPTPLSVDDSSWPSKECGDAEGFRGWFCNMYESVDDAAHEQNLVDKECELIAITLVWDQLSEAAKREWKERCAGIDPVTNQSLSMELQPFFSHFQGRNWTLLGYDVADSSCLSALSNCGAFTVNEIDSGHKSFWIEKLNDFHLFSDVVHAKLFVETANIAVVEHKPFFSMGVWALSKK
jgi:hypothetical protein